MLLILVASVGHLKESINKINHSNMSFYIYPILYGISMILGIINFHKYNNVKGKIFLSFLVVSFITELIGTAFLQTNQFIRDLIYFIYLPLSFYLWYFFFSKLLNKNKIAKIVAIVYSIIYIYDIFEIYYHAKNYDATNLKISFYFGAFSLILLSIQYFRELLNSNIILNNNRILYFWVTIGIVMMWLIYIPIMVVVNHQVFKESHVFFFNLTKFLNIVGNSCFVIGILWSQKKYNIY